MIAKDSPERIGEVRHLRPERRGVSRRTAIEEAKAKVPTIDLADRQAIEQGSRWRKVGAEWVTSCILPDHEDHTPSFTVNPEKNLWFCHGCLRGGDVVRLARLVWGYHPNEEAMAAANLLQEFGHDIPARPANWFGKQRRQKPARDALEEAKLLHVQRRVFRRFVPFLEAISDEAERLEETELMWEAAGEIAALVLAGKRAA